MTNSSENDDVADHKQDVDIESALDDHYNDRETNHYTTSAIITNEMRNEVKVVSSNQLNRSVSNDRVNGNSKNNEAQNKMAVNVADYITVPLDGANDHNNRDARPPDGLIANQSMKSENDNETCKSCCSPSVRSALRRSAVIMAVLIAAVALAAAIWYMMGAIYLAQLVLVAGVAYLAAGGGYRWFYVAIKTAPRDLRALYKFIKLKLQIRNYEKKDLILADIFRQNVSNHPNKPCFISDGREWTFAQVEEYSNKIANIFKSHGYRKGDKVALFMENRPEYVCIWLGLSKLGVITPLINTNLRMTALLHSFNVVHCKAIIFSPELLNAMIEVSPNLDSSIALYQLCDPEKETSTELKERNLTELLNDAQGTAPVVTETVGYNDHLVYIYTSGTTGLPKAAIITNSKYVFMAAGVHHVNGFTPDDRLYDPLPLYHTAGGCLNVGQAILFGCTVVIRKKFSASAYFDDCRKYECTVAQYIGEMCRYILAVPPKPEDRMHKVRIIFGNGLRPQIWEVFVERFNIPKVAEFYGATEGNANIINVDNTVGAIGFVSRIIPSFYPIAIIRVDEEGEPIRGPDGLCQNCKPNEPGVFIGKILPNDPSRAFHGYVDQKASEKKIVRDVFKKGDCAFLSGDILVADEFGNLFFKDRTGDTFRWKGENVSTSEVEAVVSNVIDYKDAVVYGVEVAGLEGRAGMTAILDQNGTLDLKVLAEGVRKELPIYARPQFVRILRNIDMTGTYKLKKNDLQKDGFDPSKISDKLFYLSSAGVYEPLTQQVFADITAGKLRL